MLPSASATTLSLSSFNNNTWGYSVVYSSTNTSTPPTFFDLNNAYMQDSRLATVCNTATTPSSSATDLDTDGTHIGDTNYVPSITMVDKRDSQAYTIRKLADGNCWMVENLRFGATSSGGARAWTTADADLSDSPNSAEMATGIIAETIGGRAGDANGGKLYYRAPSSSGYGDFWSFSPSTTAGQAYVLILSLSSVYRASGLRAAGRSVRCVLAS